MERAGKALKYGEKIKLEDLSWRTKFHYEDGETELFKKVLAGLAWPTLKESAYFCIFAKGEKKNQFGKEPLIHVFELDDDGSIDCFFEEVKKNVERFLVSSVFCLAEGNPFFLKHGNICTYLEPNGAKDFSYGLTVIKAWSKASAIQTMEGSILRAQLGTLRESDLKEVQERFNAINALRYVVSGFERDSGFSGRINLDDCLI